MHNSDVLGDEGRKALNACVKVKIYGKPETRRYDREATLERLRGCYPPHIFHPSLYTDLYTHQPTLQTDLVYRDYTKSEKATYNIVDIHDALVKCDEKSYVDKYPREGPGSDKLSALIDKRREDIEREYNKGRNNPEERLKYPWIVAQRRVRDCFAGRFPGDNLLMPIGAYDVPYNINDIHDAVDNLDERLFCVAYLTFQRRTMEETGEGKTLKTWEDINEQRAAIEKEYEEAFHTAGINQKYSQSEAEQRVEGCYRGFFPPGVVILPVKMDESGIPKPTQEYDIFDIRKALHHFDEKKALEKYPDEGPGSAELRKLIDECRDDLKKEYEMATCGTDGEQKLHEYSLCEAERRVRDCFAGAFLDDTDMFPTRKDQSGEPKISQVYDIFDIKEALDYFDAKKLCEKYPEEGPDYDKIKQSVDEQRDGIQMEYETATTDIEIENGSGFIVQEHFIITNRHVIETHLNDTGRYEILISNAAIDELPCMVAHYDAGKDLALLYCPNLNLEQHGICPLQLSNQSLLPGMPIVCFGYPISHTGKTALFVNGNVSGSKETLAGHSMIVLNCSLNSGNSGGPVLHWVNGQLKVLGIATQKHFKEILTLEEMEAIEKIRKSLQTSAIPDLPDNDIKLLSNSEPRYLCHHFNSVSSLFQTSFLLTLKLYDALETNSQFNLGNALPGKLLVDFIRDSISEYAGEHREELAEVVELAKDHVNILPSGYLSASHCCIQ